MADGDDSGHDADAWRRVAELAIRLTVADRPPSSSPRAELLRLGRRRRLTATEVDRVRRAVEADDEFRRRLGAALKPDSVTAEINQWLADPTSVAPSATRRRADEAARVRSELDEVKHQRDQLNRLAAASGEAQRLAEDRLEQAHQHVEELQGELRRVQAERDAVRAELTRQQASWENSRSQLSDRIADLARVNEDLIRQRVELDERLADLASDLAGRAREHRALRPAPPPSRQPLGVPGGLLAESVPAARSLLDRTDVVVIVDGYNAVLDPWTEGHLSQRRHVLLTALDALIAHRGPRVLVVFDGAADGGGGGDRSMSRVVYSPPEVIADDVVCAEIDRLPTTTPVVVVTDDQDLVRRVRRQGANTVSVAQLWGVLRG